MISGFLSAPPGGRFGSVATEGPNEDLDDDSGRLPARSDGRTGGEGDPIALSESYDDGQNWVNLRPIADFGVWPSAAKLDNGVVAVVTGRPGNWIQFSADEGQSWVGWHEFDNATSCNGSHYNDIVQVDSDTFLVVYHRQVGVLGCEVEMAGTFFTVIRK